MYPRIFREIILTFARNNSFQVSARLFDRFIENHNRRLRRNPRKKLDEFVKNIEIVARRRRIVGESNFAERIFADIL